MQGQQPARGVGAGPTRAALAWGFCVTVAWLVLAERFGDLLPAAAAFAGAGWVFGLEQRRRDV